ncbi:MAG TPA: sulfide/dihydroorotate dehydrogenase-like FAD/NAD-binding protein [Candidatus Mcinerneyibacterium sp.]|nr:sulfide/dihydroorotate dehydrogenase-like FAD/NAD-binding protein [Candidatus Mcinerneyibacterium sp.]
MRNQIVSKDKLGKNIYSFWVHNPEIANHYSAGQFLILKVKKVGERIPLTIADINPKKGNIRIIFQVVGLTTKILSEMKTKEIIPDILGPLGNNVKTEENFKNILFIGGGIGIAPIFPKIKEFSMNKKIKHIDSIIGAKNKDSLILIDEIERYVDNLYCMTDDGSYGEKGFVTKRLKKLLREKKYDLCIAVGPLIMMKKVVENTKKYKLKTLVSLNTIMIDGTGMCGGCRLSYNGEIKYTCVDGPIFDGYKVNFDELIKRNRQYENSECKLEKKIEKEMNDENRA